MSCSRGGRVLSSLVDRQGHNLEWDFEEASLCLRMECLIGLMIKRSFLNDNFICLILAFISKLVFRGCGFSSSRDLLSYLQIMQTLLLILRLSIVKSSWRFSMFVNSFKYSIFDPERLGDEE
jgi:hypothetical protein